MHAKYFSRFFIPTLGLLQYPFRKSIAFFVCFYLAGCGVYEERRHLNMLSKTMGEADFKHDGTAYHVEFIPLLDGPSGEPDALVGEYFVIMDSGTPAIVVRRSDSAPLEASHFQTAIKVAAIACLKNPKWNIGNSQAAIAKYNPDFSAPAGALNGDGFLQNGQWYLWHACE